MSLVSFYDALRFVNWLHNGQPSGAQNASTTEDGAYTITEDGVLTDSIDRNAGWRWAIPNENEWYKAAYFQPASQGGDSDDYWLFPTSSNSFTESQANVLLNGVNTNLPVGSYAPNFAGTFDMGGNVWEWTESRLFGVRGWRGGAWTSTAEWLRSDFPSGGNPFGEFEDSGFRVVQVPEPGSIALLAIGGLAALRRRG